MATIEHACTRRASGIFFRRGGRAEQRFYQFRYVGRSVELRESPGKRERLTNSVG